MPRQAYAELLRQALAAPDPETALWWHRQAGALLWRAEEWEDATQHFVALGDQPGARLGLAWSLVGAERLVPAAAVLAPMAEPEAAYLGGLVALRQHDVPGALALLSRVPVDDALSPSARALSAELAAWQRVPARSPAAAGLLSAALPGAGQAYVGRWGEALSALVVNGLLVTSAVELGRRELWFGMGAVLVFEAGFYGGNVMSAVNGARRFNRRAWQERLGPVEERYGMRLLPAEQGWQAQTP
ncbi:hypothetical protein L6R53_24505 [Myxococcota bacterium]|nr:hypothetical protein [Myxococcota bacterium]